MSFIRPLIAGIATGIGIKLGGDIYERIKGKAGKGKGMGGFNPWRGESESEAKSDKDATEADADKS